jgi:MFS family permease
MSTVLIGQMPPSPGRSLATLLLGVPLGVATAIHGTSSFVLARRLAEAEKNDTRAFITGLVTSMCAAGQIVVALVSGLLVNVCGGSVSWMFFWLGAVAFLLTVLVLAIDRWKGWLPEST